MEQNAILKLCKELGCCDACCLRYMKLKISKAYENPREYIRKNVETDSTTQTDTISESTISTPPPNGSDNVDGEPLVKRRKVDIICVSCMGMLQEENWSECIGMVRDMLEKKRYECKTFACGLSAPMATLLREKAIALRLVEAFKDYDTKSITPLKEAWKWSFAVHLASQINMTLDSGAISPLLITLNMEYPDDLQELEILKTLSPRLFESRSKEKRRFTVEFTRRSVEQALEGVTPGALRAGAAPCLASAPSAPARCVSVECVHAPVYLAGRYIKLSRELPQTPWVLNGKRMMESSVQEIIVEPIARVYQMCSEEVEHRLKMIAAGREDVDVRCLGDGRPFAIEITDPRRELNSEELQKVCEDISKGGQVVVKSMVPIAREHLAQLKMGEETKCKTYEALCVKLSHSSDDHHAENGDTPITVTQKDLDNINTFRNTPPGDPARIVITQKTPVRVLHRRPLLTRTRRIHEVTACSVPEHPSLVRMRVVAQAGTYVKEWAHGDLRRTAPPLQRLLRARADILALDVVAVHLPWPPAQ